MPNVATTSNVTSIIPKSDNLREAIDMLHTSQITPDYRYSALALAGALMSEVGRAFPQDMILIYLTTSYKRRQIWNCYIAVKFANCENPQPITDPDAVRAKLMNTSSKELLTEVFGSVPSGFLSALNRLGSEGQQPHIYQLLHKFMSESEEHRKSFSHASKIKAKTIEHLAMLADMPSVKLAERLRNKNDVEKLVFAVSMLSGGNPEYRRVICKKVCDAAERGGSVSDVLAGEHYKAKFPEQAVPNSVNCRFICSSDKLKNVALSMKNCLREYLSEALRDEHQYYVWSNGEEEVAVIGIKQDRPYGWRVFEIQGPENMMVEDNVRNEVIQYFEKHGVYEMPSMEGLLNDIGHALKDYGKHDPVDHIHNIIDEFLEDDPI